jgi:hypothetical protein
MVVLIGRVLIVGVKNRGGEGKVKGGVGGGMMSEGLGVMGGEGFR